MMINVADQPWSADTGQDTGNVLPPNADGSDTAASPVDPSDPSAYVGPFADKRFFGEPFAFYLGFVLLLVLLRVISESPAIPGTPSNVRVNLYNILTISITAMLGIVALKTLFARFPVPGLTQIVAAV